MNNKRDLLKRLLSLFPIKLLKEYFKETGNSEDVIESITGSKTRPALIDFVFSNYSSTRQNIYIFDLDKNFNRAVIDATFPLTIEKENLIGNEYTFLCLPQTEFSVYLSNPTDKDDLYFLQPVHIIIDKKSLVFIFTKLEKNVHTYFPEVREAKRASVVNDEENTLKKLLSFFGLHYTVTPTNFNKGIKTLWDKDDIDCYKIQWRNPHSTSTVTMDGTLTYKQKYPVDYNKIVLTQLSKSVWKYLLTDDYLCDGFTADPSIGEISITKFPKLPNQVKNVITKILTNN
jgi:hypothetical protein